MKVIIMAGGQGTRFWPWSVENCPKQFLSLMSEKTMLQQTYERFHKWLPKEKIFILTTEQYIPLVKEQLGLKDNSQLIIEPVPRDTGPCITLAACHFLKNNDDEPFAAVPADHYIPNNNSLTDIFDLGEYIAKKERSIVTLGIKPTRPETGYGYIQVENSDEKTNEVLSVKKFIEKPCAKKAEELFKMDNIYWNSGIFIWKPSTIFYYMNKFHPEISKSIESEWEDLPSKYPLLPKISIDYAVLEKADNVYTIPASFHWDDLGSWSAWERLNKKTCEGNVFLGHVHSLSTKNCIVKSHNKKTVLIGVEDLIIASTDDGLLICHKSKEQKIKEMLKEMKNEKKI